VDGPGLSGLPQADAIGSALPRTTRQTPRIIRLIIQRPATAGESSTEAIIMLVAQSLGEYGSLGTLISRVAATFDSTTQLLQENFRQHRAVWIAALCLFVAFWIFRKR